MNNTSIQEKVRQCLRSYLDSTGRTGNEFSDNTDLVQGLGLSSDEGVDFALDLCEVLQVSLPDDFNPFIHESGHHGLQVSEMTSIVDNLVSSSGDET